MSTDIDVRSLVTTEYLDLADLADSLDDAAWDTLSLCDGWRVREVIAHMTMPARYTTEQFMAELAAHESNDCVNPRRNHDAVAPIRTP